MTRARLPTLLATLVAGLLAGCSGTASPASQPPTASAPTAAAASPAAGPQWPSSVPDAWLVVGRPGKDYLDVIDAATAERFMPLPVGVPDARWGVFVEATIAGDSTTVSRLDIASGDDGTGIPVAGKWRLPTIGSDPTPVGVSADNSSVVLIESDATSYAARTVSRFAVVDLSRSRVRKVIELTGSFAFDAISPDGATLFVVQHLDASAGGRYQVRAVDVASGYLRDGVVVDKANPGETMAGWAIEQQRLAHGIVMTLYRGVEHPFIHVLNTADDFAICLDLPATKHDDADAAADWGLARSPDGGAIYAVNATIGVAVDVNPDDLSIRRTATLPAGTAAIVLAKFGHETPGVAGRRVIVSPDGQSVFAASRNGIVQLATRDLTVTQRMLSGTRVNALALAPDGRGLFALRHSDGRVVRLDVATGAVVAEAAGSGYDRLLAVVPLTRE